MDTGRNDYVAPLKTRTIPEGMPVFQLLAQDAGWSDTVQYWCAKSLEAGVPVPVVEQALQLHDRGLAWPIKRRPDADHLTVEQQVALTAEFGRRGWAFKPEGAWAAQEMSNLAGRSEGFRAGVRSLRAPLDRLRIERDDLRREAAKLSEEAAELRRQTKAGKAAAQLIVEAFSSAPDEVIGGAFGEDVLGAVKAVRAWLEGTKQ